MNAPAAGFGISEHPCFSGALELVREAGAILNGYFRGALLGVEVKADGSPVTVADKTVDSLFQAALPRLFDAPVVSEESSLPAGAASGIADFWLVDPLDGTQNFIAGEDEFSVVVALVREGRPQFGFVAAPAKGLIYGAIRGRGVWKFDGNDCQVVEPRRELPETLRVVTSRFPKPRSLALTRRFCEEAVSPPARLLQAGSAYKSLLLLEQKAEVVVSYDGVSLWDLGGVECLLDGLGYPLRSIQTGEPIPFDLARGTSAGGYFAYHPLALTRFAPAALVQQAA